LTLLIIPGFYINLPIGGLAAVLLLAIKVPDRIDRSRDNKPTARSVLAQLDLVGFLMFAPFSVMILMALQWGGTKYLWDSATIIGLFCGGGATLVLFLAWEYHMGDLAMIPFSVLRKTVVWSSCLVICFFFASLLVFSYYLPIYFQSVKGATPTMSGVYMLPSVLSQMLMAIVSGLLGSNSTEL
jgi:MFS family permease